MIIIGILSQIKDSIFWTNIHLILCVKCYKTELQSSRCAMGQFKQTCTYTNQFNTNYKIVTFWYKGLESGTKNPDLRPRGADSSTTLTCFPLLGLDLWLDVNQQCVQRQAVRQDEVADVVAADTQRLQLSGLPVFQGHFHCLQVGVHAHIDACEMETTKLKFTSFPSLQLTLLEWSLCIM